MSLKKEIRLEFTPNPNALKYIVDEHCFLEKGSLSINSKEEAEKSSLLGKRIMNIPDVAQLMIGQDYVTVTKTESGDWETLDELTRRAIAEHLDSGEASVEKEFLESLESSDKKEAMGEEEKRIRSILEDEIRPAVARDGGDVIFEKFEDGVVYLYMTGACSGCPSATATLKMGIETRLQEAVPSIKEVVAL